MDFGIIYQLKTKKFWWLDVLFYFVVTLLVATVACFFIFYIKISILEKKLAEAEASSAGTGTAVQLESEKKVFSYQEKIDTFETLFNNHKKSTNILAFMEGATLPNVWFSSFSMDAKRAGAAVSGETESTTSLTRQIAIFEGSELVKNVSGLSYGLSESGRVQFSFDISFDPAIFFSEDFNALDTISPSTSLFLNMDIF